MADALFVRDVAVRKRRPRLAPRAALVALVTACTFACGAAPVPPLEPSESGEFALRDVTVVVPGRTRMPRADLLVADGRVVSLRPTAAPPDAAARGEGAPRSVVVPGLVDLHVHWWSRHDEVFALMLLASGVTTVRDVGDTEGEVLRTRERLAEGALLGPRLFACGPILDGEPATWEGSRIVEHAAEAERAVAELAAAGVDCVKVYRNFPGRALDALARAARRRGLPLVGHVPRGVDLLEAPLDDVQHLGGVPATDALPADASFADRLEAWVRAWETLPSERLAEVTADARARGVAHTPTLVFWQRLFRLPPLRTPDSELTQRLLPEHHRERRWDRQKPWSDRPPEAARLAAVLDRMQEAVRRLAAAGVAVRAGSDSLNPFNLPGESLHAELRLLAAAGIPTEEVWAAATWQAGEALGVPRLGTLEPGAPADALLYRADPTRDLAALDTLEAVMVRGRLYPRALLLGQLERHERRFATDLYDAAARSLAALRRAFSDDGPEL